MAFQIQIGVKPENLFADTLEAEVRRLRFRNDGSGWSVIDVFCPQNGIVTLTGTMPHISEGMNIIAHGKFVQDDKYGYQFKSDQVEIKGFRTEDGLVAYLAGPHFPGIGKVLARAIVKEFGLDALDILDQEPHRLNSVPGLSAAKAAKLVESYAEQRHLHRVMADLLSLGLSPSQAAKAYKRYGVSAVQKVRENPYQMITDIHGIGFHTADEIALRNGLDRRSITRIAAATRYILEMESMKSGHCFLIVPTATTLVVELLKGDATIFTIGEAIQRLNSKGDVTVEGERIYLTNFYLAEEQSVERLSAMLAYPGLPLVKDVEELRERLDEIGVTQEITLAPAQEEALLTALTSRVVIITGGPGSGKTTLTRALCQLFDYFGLRFALCSPTGRAAKRLAEATGREAKTIHRLLELTPSQEFVYSAARPLYTDCVIVDEMSMVDIQLFRHLLSAMEKDDRLILVGDADQLPSVGPGLVLRDMIASQTIPTVRLTQVFRQSHGSAIIDAAHKILHGEVPGLVAFKEARKTLHNFVFVPELQADKVIEHVCRLATETLPKIGVPTSEIQILTPMRKRGGLGVEDLNPILQAAINPRSPQKPEMQLPGKLYRVGDRVMQLRNDYKKGVFNGDIGQLTHITHLDEKYTLFVRFVDMEDVKQYTIEDWDDLDLAFISTTHKAQGAEYRAVIFIIHDSIYPTLLQRNLFYTGVTRAKRLCIVVGTEDAVGKAIANTTQQRRNTTLAPKLRKRIAV